jgi:uncharacterized protein
VSTPDGRPRDDAGRPRNDRPRDALGRPLPRGSTGVEPVSEDVVRPVGETLAEAQRLLDAGRPFAAHEVFEAAWKQTTDPSERALWRGLAQLMVGLTHHQRGNPVGARTLLARGAESLGDVRAEPANPVDVDAWRRWGERAADAVASGDPPGEPPGDPPGEPPRVASGEPS